MALNQKKTPTEKQTEFTWARDVIQQIVQNIPQENPLLAYPSWKSSMMSFFR